MHKKGVAAEAARLPLNIRLTDLGPQGLKAQVGTKEGLDQAFKELADELKRIAEYTTPRRKVSRGQQSPWWSEEVEEAVEEARQAERNYQGAPTADSKARLNESLRALTTAIRSEKTKAWRAKLQEATHDSKVLWNLERWAWCKSFRPPDPPKLPALQDPQGGPELTTHQGKAKALARKFFPSPPADLSNINDLALIEDWEPTISLSTTVNTGDITKALSRAAPWKAPGEDGIPMGFLKACGKPLTRVLAVLIEACLRLGWFPDWCQRAKTVVLNKPGKEPAAYQTPGGYRPIALLLTIGKVVEAVVARKVTEAAEAYSLLPAEQMGNREHRSTELAVRLVVAQAQEAHRQKATASLLQLDISGAFDTVNHTRLLATLRD